MAVPNPIELCWVMRSAPQGQGIRPILHAAVEMKWQETRQLAASLLGDDAQASELTEIAVERTVKFLADRLPLGVDETSAVFMRFYRQEVRRLRARRSRLSLRGTTVDLPGEASPAPQTAVDSRLDLEAVLKLTKQEVRTALLLRYGRHEQWKEIAASTGTNQEAIRKSCQRELQRIRRRLKHLGFPGPAFGSGRVS